MISLSYLAANCKELCKRKLCDKYFLKDFYIFEKISIQKYQCSLHHTWQQVAGNPIKENYTTNLSKKNLHIRKDLYNRDQCPFHHTWWQAAKNPVQKTIQQVFPCIPEIQNKHVFSKRPLSKRSMSSA